jgi:hypothetical protein
MSSAKESATQRWREACRWMLFLPLPPILYLSPDPIDHYFHGRYCRLPIRVPKRCALAAKRPEPQRNTSSPGARHRYALRYLLRMLSSAAADNSIRDGMGIRRQLASLPRRKGNNFVPPEPQSSGCYRSRPRTIASGASSLTESQNGMRGGGSPTSCLTTIPVSGGQEAFGLWQAGSHLSSGSERGQIDTFTGS